MKANEAPEKIYLEAIYPDNGVLPNGLNYTPSPTDIEYTRTDAFIEESTSYIQQHWIWTTENKDLLLKYLCAALPYGVKILYTGWDSDSDTDFDTIETLIGIDDKFIYTIWDKTRGREKHCLSVSNWKPYLRPLSSMTEEEKTQMEHDCYVICLDFEHRTTDMVALWDTPRVIIWLLEHHFDFMGLIPKGLAIEVTETNNPYKE